MAIQSGQSVRKQHNTQSYYYQDQSLTALTASYVEQAFGFVAHTILIINDDGTNGVQLSFDGTTLHGELKAKPASSVEQVVLINQSADSIYLKYVTGAASYRIFAWG